jgi:hypothetical protein
MGVEYSITFALNDDDGWADLLSRIEPQSTDEMPAFQAELTDEGVYFCDYGQSPEAAFALRRIIDHALLHGSSVTIREWE